MEEKYFKKKYTKKQLKFLNKLLFDKEYRKEWKTYHLKMQGYILSNKDFNVKPTNEEEYKEREKNVLRLDDSVCALDLIKKLDDYQADSVINSTFKLYKKNKSLLIANTFSKESDSTKKKTFHLMNSGLPFKGKKKDLKYFDEYNIKGFELIDQGDFDQIFDQLMGSTITYIGKKYQFKIQYNQYYKEEEFYKYWIRLLEYKKL